MASTDAQKEIAKRLAQHPGMRLTRSGSAFPERWVLAVLCFCCLPGFFVIAPLPATMINPSAAAYLIPVAQALALAVTLLVVWLTLALLRTRGSPHQKSKPILGFILAALLFSPIAYGLAGVTFLRIYPLVSTYVISAPTTVTRDYMYIKYKEPCRRKCLIAKAMGTEGPAYLLRLPEYPGFLAPIKFYKEPEGFNIQYARSDRPENLPSLVLQGPANWIAIRIESLTPAPEEQA